MSLKNYNTLKSIVKKDPFSVLRMDESEWSVPILRYALKLEPKLAFSIEESQMTSVMAEAIAREVPRYLNRVPMRLRTLEICELAIEYLDILKFTPNAVLTDTFVDEALGYNPLGFSYLADEWKTKERIEQTVQDDPMVMKYVEASHHTPELAMLCAKEKGYSLIWFDESFLTDEVVDQALITDPLYISSLPDSLLTEDRINRSIARIGNGHRGIYKKLPDHLKTDSIAWEFLQHSTEVISEISIDKLRSILSDSSRHDESGRLPSDMISALKLVASKNSKACVELGGKYLAAFHEVDDFKGVRLSSDQVVALAPFFDINKLLSVIKANNVTKKKILGDQLGL